jgi:RimJ/RimL family protein N-acetyltransferase
MSAFIIRPAVPDDAAEFLRHRRLIAQEPNNGIVQGPDDPLPTEAEMRERFAQAARSANSVTMLALDSAQHVIGLAGLHGGNRQANRHTATIGIAISPEWRGQGVGTALMQALIDYARAGGVLKRLELDVISTNERAIHVYRKLGFVDEGFHPRRLFKDGSFHDNLSMALFIAPLDVAAP